VAILFVLKAIHDATYSAAATNANDRMPVHMDIDSSMPPIIAPNKFEPSASGAKSASTKLPIKTMPAKKTGRQSTRVAINALPTTETKKIERNGTTKQNVKVRNRTS